MGIRTNELKWNAMQPIVLERITTSYVDPTQIWLVNGTSTGHLTLWDLRHGLLIKQWKIADSGITTITGHPARGNGKWIIVASETTSQAPSDARVTTLMVTVDVSTGDIVERFQTSSSNSPHFEASDGPIRPEPDNVVKTPAQAVATLLESHNDSHQPERTLADHESPPACSIQAVHCLKTTAEPSFSNNDLYLNPIRESFDSHRGQDQPASSLKPVGDGTIITVGQDRIVRLWNLGHPTQSFVLSGSGKDALKRYK